MDGYGDGMCCGYGEGSYLLTDADSTLLAQGGEFGSSESQLIAISSGVNVDEVKVNNQIVLFPNPATDYLNIEAVKNLGEYQVRLVNLVGQEVLNQTHSKGNIRLDISSLVAGVYFVEVKTALGTKSQKVVVK